LSLGLLIYPENISLSSISQTILFLSNKISAFNGGQFTYVFWSIAVEWHFYFIFPILIYLLKKYNYIGLAIIIFLFELIRFTIYYFQHELRIISYWTLVGRIDQFIIGMLVGKYWIENLKLIKFKKSLIISSIILILLNSFIFNAINGATSNHVIWILWPTLEALSWALFLISYLNIANELNIFIKELFNYLGRISYSIYLIHFIVISYFIEYNFLLKFFNIDPILNAMLNTLIFVIPVTILVSSLTYKLIELPFLNLKKFSLQFNTQNHGKF
jgi:peptidoglycan/LPS O-acetylase OafA/YrhL